MRLEKTCRACPEQYNVWHGKLKIGYLRLRHGEFTAEYVPTGKRVYSAAPDGDGEFEEYERDKFIDAATAAVMAEHVAHTKKGRE